MKACFEHNAKCEPHLGKVIRLSDRYIVFSIMETDIEYSSDEYFYNTFYVLDVQTKSVSPPLVKLNNLCNRLTTQFALYDNKLLMVKASEEHDNEEISYIVYIDPETSEIKDAIHMPHEVCCISDAHENRTIDIVHMETTPTGFVVHVRAAGCSGKLWKYNPYHTGTYTRLTYEYDDVLQKFQLTGCQPLTYVPHLYAPFFMCKGCTPMETNMAVQQFHLRGVAINSELDCLTCTCELVLQAQKDPHIKDDISKN